jgi:hypothetical protein
VKLVHIIHFSSIFETGNKIDWFHSTLVSLKADELVVISWSRESFSILLLLLSSWNSSEVILVHIDYVYCVTTFDANNTTIYN